MSMKQHERGPGWDPAHPAVFAETDPSTGQIVSLEHVMQPYPSGSGEPWDSTAGPQALYDLAAKYVEQATKRLKIPQMWREDLAGLPAEKDHVRLRWHRMGKGNPRRSFFVRRRQGDDDADQSFVLLASLSIHIKSPPVDVFLYGGQGLRIAGTLERTDTRGEYLVRITGIVTTLPPEPEESALEGVPLIKRPELQALTLSAFDIPQDSIVADMGIKLMKFPSGSASDWPVEVRLDVLRPLDSGVSYRLLCQTNVASKAFGYEPIARIPLTADIAASVFAQDPVTKAGAASYGAYRPNRSSAALNGARTLNVNLGPLPKGSSHTHVVLTDPVNAYVRVTNSPFVSSEATLPPDDPKEVLKNSLTTCDVRTDTFAAINAYHHGRDLFQRMTRFGLVPDDYFKFASLPLIVRYRSGIEPGPGRDGQLINAQARWSPQAMDSFIRDAALVVVTTDGDIEITSGSAKIVGLGEVRVVEGADIRVFAGATVIARTVDGAATAVNTKIEAGLVIAVPDGVIVIEAPGQLEVCFALADLQSSSREAPAGAPLGVACDARWSWHEFGHVLLAASTGELEFRFAHSAGDAMGAILFDPESALATDPDFRYLSFPWVSWPCRRHDRKVAEGWSWTGPLYHRERFFDNGLSLKKAYWSEQILSSSLFRLYRALGGDSADALGNIDVLARRAASDFAAMLIMRAIQSMGPASVVPLLTVEKFVSVLKEADAATGTFITTNAALRRIGGVAQKCIVWAFEKQGLYGGLPPAVDVFIDDGRRGEYTPISMSGTSWHAMHAIEIEDAQNHPIPADFPVSSGDLGVYITVENRGSVASTAIDIRVDVARMSGAKIPDWLNAKWQSLSVSTMAAPIPAGGKIRVGPVAWKHAKVGTYALFAAATCAEDPSILDASSGLPCSTISGPMSFLVAGDNNLGFRLVNVN